MTVRSSFPHCRFVALTCALLAAKTAGCSDDSAGGAGGGGSDSTSISTSTGTSSGGDTCPTEPPSGTCTADDPDPFVGCVWSVDGCPVEVHCELSGHERRWVEHPAIKDGDACSEIGKQCSWSFDYPDGGECRKDVFTCSEQGTWTFETCGECAPEMACEDAPQPGEACGGACDLGTYCTAEKACGKETVVAECKDGAIAWKVLSCK